MKSDLNKEYATDLATISLTKEPPLYQVCLHNDDFTPMEFVVTVLEKFFQMDRRKAAEIMMEAHEQGKAVCGIYTKDVAETKTVQVVDYARLHEYPLVCSIQAV